MTEATTTIARPVPKLPFERPDVLHISPIYSFLRREVGPIARVVTPTGDPAWLVTGYEEARAAFSDRRFGYYTHPDPDNAPTASDSIMLGKPIGGEAFERDMVQLRKLLVPAFKPKRMRLLTDWIQELTDGCLDDMRAARDRNPTEPVDFHEYLGWRLPVLVIGALLGVPDEDRDYAIELSDRMGAIGTGMDAVEAAMELQAYMERLIAVKRKNPGPDVISDMVAAQEADPNIFSEQPLEYYAAGLVFPGHETTVARMDFGVLYLLNELRWKNWLMADPENRVGATVEEIVRLTSAHNLGLLRWAVEDIDISGVTIERGDLVIISEAAANRDPKVWPNPEEFDPTRESVPHVAFGHGGHVCLGQNLARTELRIVFSSLFRRFPDIRLTQDLKDLEIRNDRTGGGVGSVLVTW
jgi:cytochrome P450